MAGSAEGALGETLCAKGDEAEVLDGVPLAVPLGACCVMGFCFPPLGVMKAGNAGVDWDMR